MKKTIKLTGYGAAALIALASFNGAQAAEGKIKATTSEPYTKGNVQVSTQTGSRNFGQIERADKLKGRQVLTSDNQKLGKLEDTVVDLESGRILYAIVGSGGILGAGEKRYAVAPGAFTELSGNSLRLSVDKQKFNASPEFTKDIDKDTELGKAAFVNQTYQYYGQSAWWQGANTAADAGQFNNVHKSSDLIGMKVKSVSDQSMGKIENVMLSLPSGRVAYVILSPEASLELGNNLYALPPDTFTFSADRKSFSCDISKEKLAGAPHFAKNDWKALSDPAWAAQVYQYYGKQAYFDTGGTRNLKPTGREPVK